MRKQNIRATKLFKILKLHNHLRSCHTHLLTQIKLKAWKKHAQWIVLHVFRRWSRILQKVRYGKEKMGRANFDERLRMTIGRSLKFGVVVVGEGVMASAVDKIHTFLCMT